MRAMDIPADLRYTSDHEWARLEPNGVRVGITDFAQEALGDVVFIELPAIGQTLERGSKLGEVESTKSVSEVYSPLDGTVTEVNEALSGAPEQMNTDPYGEGWICLIQPKGLADVEELLDAKAYEALTQE